MFLNTILFILKYNLSILRGVMIHIFSRVTRMGSHIFGISGIRKFW